MTDEQKPKIEIILCCPPFIKLKCVLYIVSNYLNQPLSFRINLLRIYQCCFCKRPRGKMSNKARDLKRPYIVCPRNIKSNMSTNPTIPPPHYNNLFIAWILEWMQGILVQKYLGRNWHVNVCQALFLNSRLCYSGMATHSRPPSSNLVIFLDKKILLKLSTWDILPFDAT